MKLNIAYKLGITYVLIIVTTILSCLFCYYSIVQNREADVEMKEFIPALEKTKQMKALVKEIKTLSNSWIYLSNGKDKSRLNELMDKVLPDLIVFFNDSEKKAMSNSEANVYKEINFNNAELLNNVKQIQDVLSSDSAYNNDITIDQAISIYDNKIDKQTKLNEELYDKLIVLKGLAYNDLEAHKMYLQNVLIWVISLMLIIVLVISVSSLLFTTKGISVPLVKIKNVISTAAIGENIVIEKTGRSDEIGQMQNELSQLIQGLNEKISFSKEIGIGNYESDFNLLSAKDQLGLALLNMRDNLKATTEDDKKRSWVNEGMANFADILRNNNNGIEDLSNNIISNLVKYVGANQGGLFVVNDSNVNDRHLELAACYAWDKRKHIDKRVNEGEGLVGQAWQEADVIYITEVPQDFVKITSGLGGANPSCILIVPLTVNDITYGIIEIASFKYFEDYQIEFVKKLAESIASTISGSRTNERTKVLLEQSQQNTEQMRAQEEEMRQNMEEMQATSEEAERKAMNYEAAIQRLNDEIADLTNQLANSK